MPGRPKMRKLERHIESLGGDHVIFDRIKAGHSVPEITRSIRGFDPDDPEFPKSKGTIYHWIHRSEERERKWEEAKRIAAHSLVDDVDEMYEEAANGPTPSSAEVTLLHRRAEHAKWKAEKFNRDAYGDQPAQHEVNINLGDLHLNALRKKGAMPTRDDPEAITEADYDLLEEEDADRQALPADS